MVLLSDMEYQIYSLLSVHFTRVWMQAIVIHLKNKKRNIKKFFPWCLPTIWDQRLLCRWFLRRLISSFSCQAGQSASLIKRHKAEGVDAISVHSLSSQLFSSYPITLASQHILKTYWQFMLCLFFSPDTTSRIDISFGHLIFKSHVTIFHHHSLTLLNALLKLLSIVVTIEQ